MEVLQPCPSTDEQREQVDRILQSTGFSKAEILRNLLAHLAHSSIDQPGRPIKEYELGVAVLGRGKDFDPRVDSSVRVHSARLRAKLMEYYQGPGAGDPIEISIPKGAYHLISQYRLPPASGAIPLPPEQRARGWRIWGVWLPWALTTIAVTVVLWQWRSPRQVVPPSVATFWTMFASRSQETLAVFSNPRFVGDASLGLHYAKPGEISTAASQNDRYTGIGEAMALYELTRLFERMGRPLRAKRSSLVTWDEARDRDLVFLGGPQANDQQAELPELQEFAFKSINDAPHPGVGGVINLNPQVGEQRYYFNSGPPYSVDYAVIGLVPGMAEHRKALIIAGRTTFGTHGATDFLLSEAGAANLLRRIGGEGKTPFFEALIRVKVSGGVPVQPELVLFRLHKR